MRFIHTSDWHLGRQLHGQSLLDEQRHVLAQVVDLAREHKVDAVIVAGDVYDRSVPPAAAVALLDEVLTALCDDLGVAVVMIAGNHDSYERLGFGAKQLARTGLHIVGPFDPDLAPVFLNDEQDVAFYPLPYVEPIIARQAYTEDIKTHQDVMQAITSRIKQQDIGDIAKVIISHCFIDGGDESDSERPLSIGGADKVSPGLFEDFSYTALGHLHGPQFKGQPYIRYSGSILKYSFSEQRQHKSVTLVEIKDKQAEHKLLPLTPRRDVRIIEGHLDDILREGQQDSQADDFIMVRLSDTHAILDAMGKLRQVYPNVLHLERTGLMAQAQNLEARREHIKKGELQMFTDFYQQVAGQELTQAQMQRVTDVVQSLHGEDD